MAQKTEPLAHADELAELWNNLLCCQRRALLALTYWDLDLEKQFWQDLPTDTRMGLVRSMRALTEFAVDCAVALERAKASLDSTPTLREQFQAKVDELAFAPPAEWGLSGEDAAEYARRSAQSIRRELADIRARKRRS